MYNPETHTAADVRGLLKAVLSRNFPRHAVPHRATNQRHMMSAKVGPCCSTACARASLTLTGLLGASNMSDAPVEKR